MNQVLPAIKQYSVWAKQYIAKDTRCNYQTRMCIIDICTNYKNWLTDFSWECPTDPDWEGEGGGTQQTCIQGGFVPRSNPNPLPFEIPFWTENVPLLHTQLKTLRTIFKILTNYHKTGLLSPPFYILQNAPTSPFGPLQSLDRNDRFPNTFIYFS